MNPHPILDETWDGPPQAPPVCPVCGQVPERVHDPLCGFSLLQCDCESVLEEAWEARIAQHERFGPSPEKGELQDLQWAVRRALIWAIEDQQRAQRRHQEWMARQAWEREQEKRQRWLSRRDRGQELDVERPVDFARRKVVRHAASSLSEHWHNGASRAVALPGVSVPRKCYKVV